MNTKKYFKAFGENIDGTEGYGYYEFTGDLCTRQVDEFPTHLLRFQHPSKNMCDQRWQVMGFDSKDEITAEEFEDAWAKAIPELD